MKRYGYGFRELHRWMDEPSNVTNYKHRKFRHDFWKTPEEAEKIFCDKKFKVDPEMEEKGEGKGIENKIYW
jgi:hypothetical protein